LQKVQKVKRQCYSYQKIIIYLYFKRQKLYCNVVKLNITTFVIANFCVSFKLFDKKSMYYKTKYFLIILLLLSFTFAKAQAPNWTKTDCNGKSRTLYNYLDSNQVVALVFGMGCSSCADAASFFSSLKTKCALSYPGKFKAFYMDFFAGHSCGVNLLSSGLDADFDNCSGELAAYTNAAPMTYVVVAAGSSHSIIYSVKKYIFDYSDSVNIITAIDNYLSTVGIKEIPIGKNKISVYPNPTQDKIVVINETGENYSLVVSDANGKILAESNAVETKEKVLNFESYSIGEYLISIKYKSGKIESQKIIKSNQ
jgi:hypothetical protein